IEALEREGAGVTPLLAELRELVREASVWADRERDPRAREAAAALAAADRRSTRLDPSHDTLLPSASAAAPFE
ncbi:MAG TPA: hypothetical protein VFM30_01405, partial [Steroidobacteraceae bacterium]|nr:hypothetical protein [Steroidobacteraceae bacterium]